MNLIVLAALLSTAFADNSNVRVRAQSVTDPRVLIEVTTSQTFAYKFCNQMPDSTTNPGQCAQVGVGLPNTQPARGALAREISTELQRSIRGRAWRGDALMFVAAGAIPMFVLNGLEAAAIHAGSKNKVIGAVSRLVSSPAGMLAVGLSAIGAAYYLNHRFEDRRARRRQFIDRRETLADSLSGIDPAFVYLNADRGELSVIYEALDRATTTVARSLSI